MLDIIDAINRSQLKVGAGAIEINSPRGGLQDVGKLLRSVQQRRERYEFEGEVVDQVAEVMSVVIRLRETCGRHGLVGKLGSIGYCLM
jgi:hypothetical protein